jgi:DNA-binding NtrC family response regulator
MIRVLVIDDDQGVRAMLQRLLEREGYEVSVAVDGQDAEHWLEEQVFDVVITDMIMPEKEGIETILDLRKQYPAIGIIAISGGGMGGAEHYLSSAKSFGAERTFAKPFDCDEMLAAIKELSGKDRDRQRHMAAVN